MGFLRGFNESAFFNGLRVLFLKHMWAKAFFKTNLLCYNLYTVSKLSLSEQFDKWSHHPITTERHSLQHPLPRELPHPRPQTTAGWFSITRDLLFSRTSHLESVVMHSLGLSFFGQHNDFETHPWCCMLYQWSVPFISEFLLWHYMEIPVCLSFTC